jgi:HlyD family secretion protein
MDQAQHALEQAEWTYRSLLKPRDIDVDVAAAKVATQKDAVAKAKADLARTEIRAPIDGTILTIMVRAGEALGSDGLLQMGDLSNLIAIAEVDEFDIGKVTEGRTATISGPSVPTAIAGKVSRISRAVYKQKRPSSDVLVGRDANIVEVEITPASPLPPVVWGETTVKIAGAP